MMKPAACAVLLLVLAACSKEDSASKPGAPPPSTPSAASGNSPAPQPVPSGTDGPRLVLSINDAVQPVVYRGWPMVAQVAIEPPSETSVALEMAGATWTRSGQVWILPSEATAALAAGRYKIRATAGAVTGEAEVELKDEPVPLNVELKREKLQRQASSLLSAGRAAEGVDLIRKNRDAEDLGSWLLEGDALMALNRKAEAAAAYRKAQQIHQAANPKARTPALIRRRLNATTN